MTGIARVYGGSLYDLAAEEQLTGSILEQMTQVRELFRENPEYLNNLYEQLKGKVYSGDSTKNFSKLTKQLTEYEGQGILKFTGKVKVHDTLGDGKKHEEFYVDDNSILRCLQTIMNLKEAPEDYGEEDEE